jgi:ATP-dependent DNA ligase
MTPTHRGVERTPLPTWVKPQLAALVKQPPDGSDWLREIKLDGYRMHARLDAGRVKILTRRGNDWTQKYPTIANAIAGLPAQDAYLDGELCGVLPDGRTAFNLIRDAADASQESLSSSCSTCCSKMVRTSATSRIEDRDVEWEMFRRNSDQGHRNDRIRRSLVRQT